MAYEEITSGLGPGEVFSSSTATQLNENIEDTRDLVATADRFGSIHVRIQYDDAGVRSGQTIIDSTDNYSATVTGTSPNFTINMTQDWSTAQIPMIFTSEFIEGEGSTTTSYAEFSGISSSLTASNSIRFVVTTAPFVASMMHIDIEIKYDRLGVLPV